jgi:hypothetical protein
MTPFRLRCLASLLAPIVLAPAALGQVTVAPPTPNADRLAEQVRILAADPRNVSALLTAGELSTRLEDPAAAMAFFARAAAIDPGNPRIAAGRGGALVLLERPGEALKLFADAERAGVSMVPHLLQRGLAYDLIGQPGYAQRDYRAVLARGSDDEAARRLALSIGMQGKRDEALAMLEPLLRRSDRAAWRARAFILAMAGDPAGGERIAANMMSGGAALGPFLRRLPALSLADRAFAVHFGDLTTSVARRNDARFAPALTPLVEPPVAVAAVAVPVSRAPVRVDDRAAQRASSRREQVRVAAARPGRLPLAAPPPRATPAPTPTPTPTPPLALPPTPAPAQPVAVAAAPPIQVFTPPQASVVARPLTTAPLRANGWVASADAVAAPARAAPVQGIARPAEASIAPPVASQPAPAVTTPAPAVIASPPPQLVAAASPQSSPPEPAPQQVAPQTPASAPAAAPAYQPPPQMIVARVEPPARSGIDSIIGTISIPAEELDVRPPAVRPALAVARVAPSRVITPPKKAEPAKANPAKLEPARWWAQVAGGARVDDLDREWVRLAARSPAAFRGKAPWTTPLRATNRLLAGPFKSQAEAQVFVNTIGKDGLSAFAWQSEAGQRIARLTLS